MAEPAGGGAVVGSWRAGPPWVSRCPSSWTLGQLESRVDRQLLQPLALPACPPHTLGRPPSFPAALWPRCPDGQGPAGERPAPRLEFPLLWHSPWPGAWEWREVPAAAGAQPPCVFGAGGAASSAAGRLHAPGEARGPGGQGVSGPDEPADGGWDAGAPLPEQSDGGVPLGSGGSCSPRPLSRWT